MSSSVPDYRKIYQLQDSALQLITPFLDKFYLTGSTALGRFYLNHRFSDDLDFFVNRNVDFNSMVNEIYGILKLNYKIDESVTLLTPDFIRIGIIGEAPLKLEFVNDIAFRWGETIITLENIPIDNVANILAKEDCRINFDIFLILLLKERFF